MIAEVFKCDLCGQETNDIEFFRKHPEECEYVAVECDNQCGLKLYRCKINEHKEVECLMRNIKCEYCPENYIAESMIDHYKQCPKMIIECPNKCDVSSIMREQLEEHLKTDCSVKYDSQCAQSSFEVNKISLNNPLEESSSSRIQSLEAKVVQQEQQIFDLQVQLQQINNTVNLFKKNRIKTQFVWKIPNWANSVKQLSNISGKWSSEFFTSQNGYRIKVWLCLTGDRNEIETYLSVYMFIKPGEYDAILNWPFTHVVTFTLLNQTGGANLSKIIDTTNPDPEVFVNNEACFQRPKKSSDSKFGYKNFIKLDQIGNGQFNKQDTVFMKFEFEDTEI